MDAGSFKEGIGTLAGQLNVSPEAVIFLICLFSSIPLAALNRFIPTASLRALYSTLSGAALCFCAYGGTSAFLRLCIPTLLSFVIIRAIPRYCGYAVYLAGFAYLIFCHAVSLSGDVWRSGGIDFTGTLMIFTLKFVGCAMDVQDGQTVHGEKANQRMYAARLEQAPSFLEFLGYVFFPGAVLVGPVFDLKAYRSYIRKEGVWSTTGGKGTLAQVCVSTLKLVITLVGYQYLISVFPGTFVGEPGFFNMSFSLRWMYTVAAGFAFRWMYYFLWSVAEVAMVLSEFGYSGQSDHDPTWSRGINGNLVKVEFTTSTSQMPAYWNIWVGRWLRTYVYDRLTPLSGKPTVWTLIATQIVSALWHGLHPGYYLFFINAAIAQNASKVVFRLQQVAAPQATPAFKFVADVAQSVFKTFMINYSTAGFLILRADKTLAVWKSLFFLGTIIPLVISIVVPPLTPRPRKKD